MIPFALALALQAPAFDFVHISDTHVEARRACVPAGIAALILGSITFAGFDPPTTEEPAGPYSTARDDSWNGAHRAMFHRRDEEGVLYGPGELDPLLGEASTWLLAAERAREFETAVDSAQIDLDHISDRTPAARAVFQRDLWAVHDWLAARGPGLDEVSLAVASRLRERAARLMRGVALAPSEVPSLNDRLRIELDAIADPILRELLARDATSSGAWITLSDPAPSEYPLAAAHSAHFGPRSAFTIHFRLPEGRAAGEKYLERLRAGPTTVTVDGVMRLSPDLPQPPVGTQVALVRRALHVDSAGELHVTDLIEGVQLRRFTRLDTQTLARDDTARFSPETWRAYQEVREFVLDRSHLGEGRVTLRELGPDARKLGSFGSHGEDPLDNGWATRRGYQLATCMSCHGAVGAFSMASLTGPFGPGGALEAVLRTPPRSLVPEREPSWRADALRWSRSRPEVARLLASWSDGATTKPR